MSAHAAGNGRGRIGRPLVAAVFSLAVFWGIGATFLDGYALDLGSLLFPPPRHMAFLALWGLFGALAAGFVAAGLLALTAEEAALSRLRQQWEAIPDRRWVVIGSLLAFVLPVALRALLLEGAPLTDDESAYRFAASLLASGRLYVESPPLPEFFDQNFMINDSRLYPCYFLGWPALLVPGVLLGIPGLMNPLYSALTVPGLFLVGRRLCGSGWAKATVLLYLFSPFLMVAAATQLAHTTCLMALVWTTWFALRSRDEAAPWWSHAGLGLAFCVAFFIRPLSAVGVGLPFLVWWLWGLRSLSPGRRLRVYGSFLLVVVPMAMLFVGVMKAQNGSWLKTGYQRYAEYLEESNYRFSSFTPEQVSAEFPGLRFDGVLKPVARMGVGAFRLNFALFGWPCSLLLALFARRGSHDRLLWWSLLSFLLFHFFQSDTGIDSFGPVHWFELAWPLLLLTASGAEGLRGLLESRHRPEPRVSLAHLPAALVVALVLTSWLGYVPVRFRALASIAENIHLPFTAAAEANLGRAVVFSPAPFVPNCKSRPTRHWVLFRPVNDPDLENAVLWVNHLGVEADRRLMRHFPERRGYLMRWTQDCRVEFLPLAAISAGPTPSG